MNQSFWERHKRKIIITAALGTATGLGAYWLYSKATQYVDEVHRALSEPHSNYGMTPQRPMRTGSELQTPGALMLFHTLGFARCSNRPLCFTAGSALRTPQSAAESAASPLTSAASLQHLEQIQVIGGGPVAGRDTCNCRPSLLLLASTQDIAERATLPSLLPALKLKVFAMTDLDAVSKELRAFRSAGTSSSQEQAPGSHTGRRDELWKELNTVSFSRALAVVWGAPLLGLFVKVQLTVLARALREQRLDLASPLPASSGSPTSPLPKAAVRVQERFINLADGFAGAGLGQLVGLVRQSVELLVGTRDLKQGKAVACGGGGSDPPAS